MSHNFFDTISLALTIIGVVVLASLLFSRARHRVLLLSFWQNVLVLMVLVLASKVASFFDFLIESELLFVFFSFVAMVLMLIAFSLNYNEDECFDVVSSRVKDFGKQGKR